MQCAVRVVKIQAIRRSIIVYLARSDRSLSAKWNSTTCCTLAMVTKSCRCDTLSPWQQRAVLGENKPASLLSHFALSNHGDAVLARQHSYCKRLSRVPALHRGRCQCNATYRFHAWTVPLGSRQIKGVPGFAQPTTSPHSTISFTPIIIFTMI